LAGGIAGVDIVGRAGYVGWRGGEVARRRVSVRKFVAQLVRRLPQGAADFLSKASESLKIKQT